MLDIAQIDPLHPDALRMIEGSEQELAAIYPAEVRFAFSPQELVDAEVRFFVARNNGTAVGCCGYAVLDGYAELKRLFVTPEARGSRAASALVETVEQAAGAEGVTLMRLETGKESPAALRFYERQGYETCGPFGAYDENGSSVFMEKALTEA